MIVEGAGVSNERIDSSNMEVKDDRILLVLWMRKEQQGVTFSGRFRFLRDCYTFAAPFNKRTGFPPPRE